MSHTSPPSTIPPSKDLIVKFQEGAHLEESGGILVSDRLRLDTFYDNIRRLAVPVTVRQSFPRLARRRRPMRRLPRQVLPPAVELFVRIRFEQDPGDWDSVLSLFRADPEVEYVVRAFPVVPAPPQLPIPAATTPDYLAYELHHEPGSAGGVGSMSAWEIPGGRGVGVNVCICDRSFIENHEDLPTPIQKPTATALVYSAVYSAHGTQSLGTVGAVENTAGTTGIAPAVQLYFCPVDETASAESIEGAMDYALGDIVATNASFTTLNAGDVLLVEVVLAEEDSARIPTGANVPVDANPDVRAAIVEAAEEGVIVVCAAGNTGSDLRQLRDPLGKYIWNPDSGDHEDSKAILVGAGYAGAGGTGPSHAWMAVSNYGRRVNCQGWGEKIVTTGGGVQPASGGQPERGYTEDFGQTSGASAMVAGVVAALQGAVSASGQARLTPQEVRDLLSNVQYGTPQPGMQADGTITAGTDADRNPIGPLPDLEKLMGLAADVALRDQVEDALRAREDDDRMQRMAKVILCRTPDIIIRRPLPEPDPILAFGIGSWNLENLSEDMESGAEHFLHVRLCNQGTVAGSAKVTLFWTEPSPFSHPSAWREIGSLHSGKLAPGQRRALAESIAWTPDLGRFRQASLVARTEPADRPFPIPDGSTSWDDWVDFSHRRNHIRFRNMLTARVDPRGRAAFEFLVRGAFPGRFRSTAIDAFSLRLHHGLPDGAGVVLGTFGLWPGEGDAGNRRTPAEVDLLKVNPRSAVLQELPLARGSAVLMNLQVALPEATPPGRYPVYLDQYLGRDHLGRMNLMIQVPRT